ncbi:TlpA disulfide reductase family protein [Pseudotenacibaculum sp. MALMAid0570]|uniref:TlpA family protein disulfide reductase n=1 Tax=Pseudotenacibaculum sp. MALMAid0570 TaxID=3143938 RepID=UPI0032DF411F
MKKLLILFLLISSFAQAQYSVKGNIHPPKKYTWVLLYKVEGARQLFVKNTQIKQEVKQVDGKNITIGTFEFELPADTKTGSYRITYDLQQNGFVDFLFNKENVELSFNPGDVEGTTVFSTSKENQLYKRFLNDIALAQYQVDSLQVAYLKNPSTNSENAYNNALSNVRKVQSSYTKNAQGTLAYHFIKATDRYNSPTIAKSSQEYLDGVISHFFDKIDFSNSQLYNSSFLIDRIADYVFYMNYSNNAEKQQQLYKKAVDVAIGKVTDITFKADVIEFLTSQFSALKNVDLVDYLLANHFNKLPKDKQNLEFKKRIEEAMAIAIGRIAPDFSWTENGKEMSLSQLKGGQSYLLIFYSTECGHCLREIPQIYDFMKDKTKTKVIAFAMETSDTAWKNYIKNLSGWHHPLGLGKWENKIARTYQVNSTPTYFVLGMDKKIIANPEKIEDLKVILGSLN